MRYKGECCRSCDDSKLRIGALLLVLTRNLCFNSPTSQPIADLDCANLPTNSTADTCNVCTSAVLPPPSNFQEKSGVLPTSKSVPLDLQLCSCYMRDFEQNSINLSQMLGLSYEVDTRQLRPSKNEPGCRNVSKFSQVFNLSSGKLNQDSKQFRDSLEQATRSPEKSLNEFIKPRKLKLDKTLSKFKMHKSLPVSPVSEERQFADFVEMKTSEELPQRQSFR